MTTTKCIKCEAKRGIDGILRVKELCKECHEVHAKEFNERITDPSNPYNLGNVKLNEDLLN